VEQSSYFTPQKSTIEVVTFKRTGTEGTVSAST
jgi:hypothetical protein